MAEWIIREPRVGPIVLWCDRKQIGTYDTVPDAERAAYWQMDKKTDTVIHQEPDGYLYRLRVPKRRGWRQPKIA